MPEATIETHRVLRSVLEAIRAHAAACLPREACGVLLGRENEILAGRPVQNLAGATDRFDADPLQLAEIETRARAAGLQVLGYYHSHPNAGPLPSHADRQRDPWPDLPPHLHLIVSPQHGWKLYNTQAGRWSPVAVEVLAAEREIEPQRHEDTKKNNDAEAATGSMS